MRGLGPRLRASFGLFLALIWLCIGNPPAGATPTAPDAASAAMFAAVGGSQFGLDTHIATRFGIYGQQGGPMDMAQGTGAGWIREEIRWDWIQHPIGQWDWGFTDEMVQDAQSRNLNILGLLGYNNSAQNAGTVNFTVPDIGLWKTFVLNTVYRYKDRVHVWEIWNEPDNAYFWKGSVADYVNLLRETYTTIKSVDPTAVVMNGACSNLDLIWFNQFLDAGGANYADVLGFHPYAARASLDNGDYQKNDLAHFRDIQARTGKPWWFTEIGWSSASGSGVGSERAQASYMTRQYVLSLDYPGLDVRHIFWYDFHDDGTDPGNSENNYGLIRNDWATPKFAYTAYRQMTAHLNGATPQGTVDAGAGTAYRFLRGGTVVDIVWGSGHATLPTMATQAQAFDMAGNLLPVEVSGGQIHLDVGGDPVFIEHSGAPMPALPLPSGQSYTLPAQSPSLPPGYAGSR
ncbi:MAG: glycosyl hydrolase [Thermomicrobiales bacterium]